MNKQRFQAKAASWAVLCTALTVAAGPARADPAAIVEAVTAPDAGVGFMDYLTPGRVIELGAKGELSLGYLRSCLNEKIVGGRVRIGDRQSAVDGGTVARERVECDGGHLVMATDRGREGAAMAFRGEDGQAATPSLRVFCRRPLFQISNGASEIRLERIDRPGRPLVLPVKGRYVDLRDGKPLAAGGLYRVTAGDTTKVFRIDAFAPVEPGAVLSRLVPL